MQHALIAAMRPLADSAPMPKGESVRGSRRAAMFESSSSSKSSAFQLCFRSLTSGRDFAFPCDAEGHVDLDHMSERTRNNYFYARAMMGREVGYPAVQAAALH
jgi:hypothetical protein